MPVKLIEGDYRMGGRNSYGEQEEEEEDLENKRQFRG